MPRYARIDHPGLLQHVIGRGIEKRKIFLDDQDRDSFVSRLHRELQATGTDCYAWALMDSHFHLLLRPTRVRLGDFMRRLLTGHAVVFNFRHNRSGHLFQNRYKSIVCDRDAYLLELIRYIHLNPIRAGILPNLEALSTWRWSGHAELLGKAAQPLVAAEDVLSHFAGGRNAARQKYLDFLSDGLKETGPDLSMGGKRITLALDPSLTEDDSFDERIPGGGTFVDSLMQPDTREGTGQPISLEDLAMKISAHYHIDPERLRHPDRERKLARCKAVLCHVALRHLGVSGVELAGRTALSPSGVSRAAKRGATLLGEDDTLRNLLLRPEQIN